MDILNDVFYILIEGEPNSPEVDFIQTVIGDLKYRKELPLLDYDVVEVGGSEAFNSMARIIYKKSNLHQKFPVLAIKDRDFRSEQYLRKKQQRTDRELLQNHAVREVFWPRHEWENFLLEDTEIIAEIFNKIPVKQSGKNLKIAKRNSIILTSNQLDHWLLEYFKQKIGEELVECLKCNFDTASICPQLDNPSDRDILNINTLENWFKQPITNNCTPEKLQDNLAIIHSRFQNVLAELDWQIWLNNPESINFEQAKIFLRGKEALNYLLRKVTTEIGLIPEIKTNKFLKDILLPELKKAPNCVLIQEIKIMLLPYFQKVVNN
jgi:hypothetical protein